MIKALFSLLILASSFSYAYDAEREDAILEKIREVSYERNAIEYEELGYAALVVKESVDRHYELYPYIKRGTQEQRQSAYSLLSKTRNDLKKSKVVFYKVKELLDKEIKMIENAQPVFSEMRKALSQYDLEKLRAQREVVMEGISAADRVMEILDNGIIDLIWSGVKVN